MSAASLCQLAQDWRGDLPPGGMLAEEKRDGWRCLYFRGRDGKARLWTRNGIPIEGADHILYRLGLFESVAGQPLFIDGEYQVDGTLAATKDWCERGWKQGGERGIFHAFDCLPHSAWLEGGSDQPLLSRKASLAGLAVQVEQDPSLSWEWRPGSHGRDGEASPVVIAPDFWLFDANDVRTMARRVWAGGGEGLMLKDAESPYRRTRNAAWLKVKQENWGKWTPTAA